MKNLIITTLAEIEKAVEAQLGHPASIASISYPGHLSKCDYITTLAYTAIEVYPEVKDVLQLRTYLDLIRLAYGLNNASALEYPDGTDLDNELPLLIHFDYQTSFLEVSIMEVDEFCDIRSRSPRIDDFGGHDGDASVRAWNISNQRLTHADCI